MRELWLNDLDAEGVNILLEGLLNEYGQRRQANFSIGDFNEVVQTIIDSGVITENKATFVLLDQRTFECHWSTVQKLAACKSGNKVEQFYFLASGWLDRSIAAVRLAETAERLNRWWGRDSWSELRGMNSTNRAMLVADRFRTELGYAYAEPFAIYSKMAGGRVMYHMIHASDHPEAVKLMMRAHRRVGQANQEDTGTSQIALL